MAASRNDVDRWIENAIYSNCEFIISVCDTFDWEDYPVYCKDKNELKEKYEQYNGVNMQRINEVIQIVDGKKVYENLNIKSILS